MNLTPRGRAKLETARRILNAGPVCAGVGVGLMLMGWTHLAWTVSTFALLLTMLSIEKMRAAIQDDERDGR